MPDSSNALPSTTPARRARRALPAFTLVELLVVVSTIGLLISILVPALSRARFQARLTVCGGNLRQLGVGVAAYAVDQGAIPNGPHVQALGALLEANDGRLATSQVWTGPQPPLKRRMALGLLLNHAAIHPRILYCPGDDSNDPQEELPKVQLEKMAPAYGSYLYRQLDETEGSGRLENLGRNGAGGKAAALAFDMNSLITVDPSFARTNHRARRVNVLFADGSVAAFDNRSQAFSLRDQDLPDLAARRDALLQYADARYWPTASPGP